VGFLKALFGPSKEQIWRQLSHEVEGEFIEGGLFRTSRVQAQAGDWLITLDTYTTGGKNKTTYTRIRAPFVNREGLQFTVYRTGVFSELGKFLGMQDIEVGYPGFDREFVIKGNDESRVQALFANPRIRELLRAQPAIYLHVADDEGFFGPSSQTGSTSCTSGSAASSRTSIA